MGLVGEWAVGQWIVSAVSFQKMYGLCGINIISGCHRCGTDGRTEEQHRKIDLFYLFW